jgi:hypothetical protein
MTPSITFFARLARYVIVVGAAVGGASATPSTPGTLAPTVKIAISPNSIAAGQNALMTWSSTNASTCTASGAWSLSQPTSGSIGVSLWAVGRYTYTLSCSSSAGATATASATLTVTPGVGVSGAPKVTVSPVGLTFGPQFVGTTSPVQELLVTNSGAVPLNFFSVTASSGPFAVNNYCDIAPNTSYGPGSSCQIDVWFTPGDPGTATGTLSISDDAAGSPQTVSLSGIGSTISPLLNGLATAREEHTATRLLDGRVLIAGGFPSFITAELYEPAQQTFNWIPDMRYGRRAHTATLLPASGFVLIAGGEDQSGIPLSTAELFIPASATFTPIHPMTTARASFSATLLKTNQVLIAGGDSTGTAELFNPTTQTFTRIGTMNQPRVAHAAVLLTDGRVLITGGDPAGNTAELFDPKTGRFSLTGPMLQSRYSHTATLISGGNVLIAGGWANQSHTTGPLSSAEIYEPASGQFFAIPPMISARAAHTATALLDGTVLVAGGSRQIGQNTGPCGPRTFYYPNSTVERFNPATRQFTLVSADSLVVPRYGQTATRLLTGDVLVTGGWTLVRKVCFPPLLFRPFTYEQDKVTASAEMIH